MFFHLSLLLAEEVELLLETDLVLMSLRGGELALVAKERSLLIGPRCLIVSQANWVILGEPLVGLCHGEWVDFFQTLLAEVASHCVVHS